MVKKIKLVTYKVPNNFEDYDPKYPDIIKVIMNDGSILIEKISHIKGGKNNPLKDEDIEASGILQHSGYYYLFQLVINYNLLIETVLQLFQY